MLPNTCYFTCAIIRICVSYVNRNKRFRIKLLKCLGKNDEYRLIYESIIWIHISIGLKQFDDLFEQQAAGHYNEKHPDKSAPFEYGQFDADVCTCHVEETHRESKEQISDTHHHVHGVCGNVGHGIDSFGICGSMKKVLSVNEDQPHDQQVPRPRTEKSIVETDQHPQQQSKYCLLTV